jgi:hypothetical protein
MPSELKLMHMALLDLFIATLTREQKIKIFNSALSVREPGVIQ